LGLQEDPGGGRARRTSRKEQGSVELLAGDGALDSHQRCSLLRPLGTNGWAAGERTEERGAGTDLEVAAGPWDGAGVGLGEGGAPGAEGMGAEAAGAMSSSHR
jgi:hypothetical protein